MPSYAEKALANAVCYKRGLERMEGGGTVLADSWIATRLSKPVCAHKRTLPALSHCWYWSCGKYSCGVFLPCVH